MTDLILMGLREKSVSLTNYNKVKSLSNNKNQHAISEHQSFKSDKQKQSAETISNYKHNHIYDLIPI